MKNKKNHIAFCSASLKSLNNNMPRAESNNSESGPEERGSHTLGHLQGLPIKGTLLSTTFRETPTRASRARCKLLVRSQRRAESSPRQGCQHPEPDKHVLSSFPATAVSQSAGQMSAAGSFPSTLFTQPFLQETAPPRV